MWMCVYQSSKSVRESRFDPDQTTTIKSDLGRDSIENTGVYMFGSRQKKHVID